MFWCIPDVSGTIPGDSGHFWKNNQKNVDFARVSFQFLAQGLRAVRVIPGLTTDLGSSSKDPPGPRAVLAGVPETYRKNRREGLNVSLAGGPSFFHDGSPEGKCFAPFDHSFRKIFPRAS